jgi:anti-sigma regulatory factor (Ser/Thr protein kinase)
MPSPVDATEPIELKLAALPQSIAVARRAVAEYAERVGADPFAVKTCVSEAVTNAVIHGYQENAGEIEVRASRDGEALVISVSDAGGGIRPNPRRGGLGLGLPIIGRLADEVRVTSDGGTLVEMRFRL